VVPGVRGDFIGASTNLIKASSAAQSVGTNDETGLELIASPTLRIEVQNLQTFDDLRVIFLTDDGRRLRSGFRGITEEATGKGVYQFAFDPDHAKSISVGVFVNRAREFEYFVNPKDVRMVKE
jgi:hypothetical protein